MNFWRKGVGLEYIFVTARSLELRALPYALNHPLRAAASFNISLYRIVWMLGEKTGLKVHPHGLRHAAIAEACQAAQSNGIALEEVLHCSRHSRKSVAILMIYRDRERNVQGQLASMMAADV